MRSSRLTVVRMVPVAIALAGTGLDRATVAFVGWFGPRGLASVVFALIAYDSLDPTRRGPCHRGCRVHGRVERRRARHQRVRLLATRYGRYVAGLHPDQPEHAATPALRTRSMAGDRVRTVDIARQRPT